MVSDSTSPILSSLCALDNFVPLTSPKLTTTGTVIPIVMKMSKNIEHADEKASGIAGEVLGSIRMIVACGSENRTAKKYSGWVEESRKRTLKMSPWVGVQFSPRMCP